MSGPWEKYQAESSGPWDNYKDQAPPPADQTQPLPPEPDSASNLWGSSPELRTAVQSDNPVWNSLQVPSQMAQRGLQQVSEALKPNPEVTGNLGRDLLMNYPSTEFAIAAKAAPGFIDRTSLLMAGGARALKAISPVGSIVGQGVAGQLESATGANPGSLGRAWNDPTLIFSEGKSAASPMYEAGKTGGKMAENLRGIPLKDDFIDIASQLADEGKLPPETALEARKISGKLLSKGGGKYTEDFLRGLVEKFDTIAKSNENISAGDAAYRRGIDAASLRKILPSNKYGGTSAFKTGIMAAVPGAKYLLSPVVHGTLSTLGGLSSKFLTNPAAAITARQALITQFIENRSQGSNQ